MGMLRITIAERLTEQKWTLEDRLVQPWISELKSTWTKTENARRVRKCVVDLTGVTFIDKNGEKVLAELSKEGAELIATGCYTQHVVHTVNRRELNRAGQRTIAKDEYAFLVAAKRGDSAAFEILCKQSANRVFHMAR